ncbi:hypothetical protein M2262_005117 [Pseudomonas sp. BIGb0408]|uniref:Uncharacterized protein n=1 Tax=Phytopseudomonas flavescens TaxID=29435 RepID=A0A7Y9XSX4_9GAMM|nr:MULTISPECIES: hypothetical protein [Pseudomonas]MCW2295067.1 hypothetical protein [Pseudomonas sp. BIGb0408]NYH75659.1 hypothetical protein [Pseudomonas flavescens]
MSISLVQPSRMLDLISQLSCVMDFEEKLPSNVFINEDFHFAFFERPLLSFDDIFSAMVSGSILQFGSEVFVKFSGNDLVAGSCLSISGADVDGDSAYLSKKSEDFFGGKFSYPIILFNGGVDWVAVETAYEELGVIAIRSSAENGFFNDFIASNFISCDELKELANKKTADGITARAFASAYCM